MCALLKRCEIVKEFKRLWIFNNPFFSENAEKGAAKKIKNYCTKRKLTTKELANGGNWELTACARTVTYSTIKAVHSIAVCWFWCLPVAGGHIHTLHNTIRPLQHKTKTKHKTQNTKNKPYRRRFVFSHRCWWAYDMISMGFVKVNSFSNCPG